MYKFSESSISNTIGVHPDLVLIATESIKVSPIDFGIPSNGGVRTAEIQYALHKSGKSERDGYARISKHQIRRGETHGRALDVFAYVNGKASWAEGHLSMIAGVMLSTAHRLKRDGLIDIDLYWGGQFGTANFDGWDMPHFEVLR